VYTATELNTVINSYAGSSSVLRNRGAEFISAQNTYGVNALLELAFACLESAYGTSEFAVKRYNLFGINAGDADPNDASFYSSVSDCINYHAGTLLSRGYFDALSDWRYAGTNTGNKKAGVNVAYASDPYHGEKIASVAYQFDKALGKKDYGRYTIGVSGTSTAVYTGSNGVVSLYKLMNGNSGSSLSGLSVVILGTSGDYYKVQSDMPIINGQANYAWTYSFSHVGYVKKSEVTTVYQQENASYTVKKPTTSGYHTSNPGTVVLTATLNIYSDSNLKNKTGKKLAKNSTVKVSSVEKRSNGTYALKVSGGYISARKLYSQDRYYANPGTVVLTANLNIYSDVNSKVLTGTKLAKGTTVKVLEVVGTSSNLPKFRVEGGYISALAGYSTKYHQNNPGSIVLTSTLNIYSDPGCTKKTGKKLTSGSTVKVKGLVYSSAGVPRFQVDGGYISALASYSSQYFQSNPGKVKLTANLNVYSDTGMTKKTGNILAKGTVVNIEGIEYSGTGIPRFKVSGGYISTLAKYSNKS